MQIAVLQAIQEENYAVAFIAERFVINDYYSKNSSNLITRKLKLAKKYFVKLFTLRKITETCLK